jgi:hypothetical protein
METGDIIVFVLSLVGSGVFVAMGIPLSQGWVRPNRLYGFRTPKTLHDPDVWYPTNRVGGYWGIATGIVGAVVSVSTFFSGLGLLAAAWLNFVPFGVGIVGIWTHGLLVIRRVTREKQTAGT